MIGRLNPASKSVTIIGAGISGLLSAYFLDRAGYKVHLIEASDRGGGLISTTRTPLGLVEGAAHSLPATSVIREICGDLGVDLEPIRPDAKARYIFRSGKLRKFPLGPLEAIAAFLRAYFVLAPARDPESLTVEQWTNRFLGKKALRYLMTPMVRGIYGAAPAELSVSAAFPAACVPRGHSLLSYLLAKRWRRVSGVRRATQKFPRGPISAPRSGMQSLTDALSARLEQKLGGGFERGRKIENLSELKNLENLILCVPAAEAARLLFQDSPELSSMLAQVGYSPLTSATIFIEESAFRRSPRGLGVLIPETEKRDCLGILFNSSAFPGRVAREGVISLTMMFDGSAPRAGGSELSDLIGRELRAILGAHAEPLEIHARRWERAVPKYDDHLLKTWECAERSWCAAPGRVLFGNYTGQVSIRGMAEFAKRLPER